MQIMQQPSIRALPARRKHGVDKAVSNFEDQTQAVNPKSKWQENSQQRKHAHKQPSTESTRSNSRIDTTA
ncbi:MAG: hypothetical protein IIC60_07430 [Proteobacteria bacterium]|nr:hypothetical protein [Pseudomonadota bacterium]